MSYLLKALKKAEEERLSIAEGGESASVATIQVQSALPVWLVLLVVFLLVATAWKLFVDEGAVPEGEQLVQESYAITQSQLIKEVPSEHTENNLAKRIQEKAPDNQGYQLSEGEVLVEPTGKKLTYADDPPTALNANGVGVERITQRVSKQLAELTKNELSQIPNLSLESHLFSSVASYSSVVINGGTYAEGDYINSDIIIEKINAEGILISLGDLLVELPKGITWVSNKHVK